MLRSLTRLAFSKGLRQGSRGWMAVGAAALGLRAVARLVRRDPDVVYSEELVPGQQLVITHLTRHVG